jgi:hypothetical protein
MITRRKPLLPSFLPSFRHPSDIAEFHRVRSTLSLLVLPSSPPSVETSTPVSRFGMETWPVWAVRWRDESGCALQTCTLTTAPPRLSVPVGDFNYKFEKSETQNANIISLYPPSSLPLSLPPSTRPSHCLSPSPMCFCFVAAVINYRQLQFIPLHARASDRKGHTVIAMGSFALQSTVWFIYCCQANSTVERQRANCRPAL